MDISNGPGIRVSIFMQGCSFNCKNCFNPETHDFNGGTEFTDDTINQILDLVPKKEVLIKTKKFGNKQGNSLINNFKFSKRHSNLETEALIADKNKFKRLLKENSLIDKHYNSTSITTKDNNSFHEKKPYS